MHLGKEIGTKAIWKVIKKRDEGKKAIDEEKTACDNWPFRVGSVTIREVRFVRYRKIWLYRNRVWLPCLSAVVCLCIVSWTESFSLWRVDQSARFHWSVPLAFWSLDIDCENASSLFRSGAVCCNIIFYRHWIWTTWLHENGAKQRLGLFRSLIIYAVSSWSLWTHFSN